MFWPVPDFTRQEALRDRDQQGFKLPLNDLVLGGNGQNTIKYRFVEIGNAHLGEAIMLARSVFARQFSLR